MQRILRRALLIMLVTTGILLGGIFADGVVSGWRRLAVNFAAPGDAGGLEVTLREGGLGNPRWYHRVAPLRASVGFDGLRLSYPFPYRVGHPPLLIPWTQLRVLDASMADGETTVLLSVALPERARVSLSGDLAAVVREWLAPGR